MSTTSIGEVQVELVKGDIAAQPDLDAVVNAANARLTSGSGVAGALHGAAGPGLADECRPLAPIDPGQAVMTGAHDLPNRAVVHCLGPVYGRDEPSEVLLAACYRNALGLADAAGLTSIGFPALSTGVFGYPVPEAARVALHTVVTAAPGLRAVRLVRFVLFSAGDLAAHRAALEEVLAEP